MQLTARAVLNEIYYPALALCGALLLYLFPPHFTTSAVTLIAVAVVALFLVVFERPAKAAGVTVAPVEAIFTASVVLFGWWTLLFIGITALAVHFRAGHGRAPLWKWGRLLGGQIGLGVIALYCMIPTWAAIASLAAHQSPAWSTSLSIAGIIAVGMIWQTVTNLFTVVAYSMAGQEFAAHRLVPVGLLAAVYAYILVAAYNFGGIVGAAIFYIFIGQERMVRGVLGLTEQLQQLHRARAQARTLVGDLMRFADVEHGRFGNEVQLLSQRVASRMGLPKEGVASIGLAAELHDIGKARLSAKIRANGNGHGRILTNENGLNEPAGEVENVGQLSPSEIAQLKTYPRAGALMVRQADALLPREIAHWIECHDEHFDGTGFPRGLAGDQIPLPSRIIAVAREFVRLTIGANGDYEQQKDSALASIRERSGTLYDPAVVELLKSIVLSSSEESRSQAYERYAEQ